MEFYKQGWLPNLMTAVSSSGQRKPKELLEFNKRTVHTLTRILKGSLLCWEFRWQARSSLEGTESVQDLLCECRALQNRRHWFLNDRTFNDLGHHANVLPLVQIRCLFLLF